MIEKNRNIANVLKTMAMPMIWKTMPSKLDWMLKCEVVPRADCMMIMMISITMAVAMVQRTVARARGLFTVSGINHATVQRKIVIEVRNFIGLIHGLSPRICRVSLIEI